MRVETGLSPALTLKTACVGKNASFCYFKKNVRVKGLINPLRPKLILVHQKTQKIHAYATINHSYSKIKQGIQ